MARRTATPADTSSADLDYEMLQMDNGRLWTSSDLTLAGTAVSANAGVLDSGTVRVTIATDDESNNLLGTIDADTGAIKTAVELIDNVVAVLGTATYSEATTSGAVVGAVRNDTLATLANTDNEIAPLQVNTEGALYVAGGVAHDAADSGESIKIGGRAQDILCLTEAEEWELQVDLILSMLI
jgi:hypothetical protein